MVWIISQFPKSERDARVSTALDMVQLNEAEFGERFRRS